MVSMKLLERQTDLFMSTCIHVHTLMHTHTNFNIKSSYL
jgi:hypothetical protein